MFNLDRFIPVPGIRRVPRARGGRWLARRRRPLNHAKRIRTALPALCGVGVAAAVAWMLAGGSLPSFEAILGQPVWSWLRPDREEPRDRWAQPEAPDSSWQSRCAGSS